MFEGATRHVEPMTKQRAQFVDRPVEGFGIMCSQAVETDTVSLDSEDLVQVDDARDPKRLATQEIAGVETSLGFVVYLYAGKLEVASLDDRPQRVRPNVARSPLDHSVHRSQHIYEVSACLF